MWIGGHTDERPGRVHHEVTSPVTGEVVALVDQASPPDVDRAVQVAAEAMKAHRYTPRYVRAAWLEDAAQRFDLATDTFTDSLVSLIGKPRRLARAEALRGSEILRRCAAELGSLSGETLPLDAVPAGEGRFGLTFREPLGVVAAITPFNAPINLMLQKVAPALAMGNAVVIKPSPETAVVTLQVVQAISPAFPDGLLSVVCGGADTGQALVAHRNVAAVSLTGSTAAGESVLRSAGIKPVLLELGANSPNLVLADADLPAAASAIAAAAFSASGQQCVSAQRVIVAQPVADAFTDLLVAASAALVVGDPDHDATDIGPMVHQAARDRVVELIDDAERPPSSSAPTRTPGCFTRRPSAQWSQCSPPRTSTRQSRSRTPWTGDCRRPASPMTSVPRSEPRRNCAPDPSGSTRPRDTDSTPTPLEALVAAAWAARESATPWKNSRV
jgi:glyceraldehyde-3-phosphate dehydrogenase (NADP+)